MDTLSPSKYGVIFYLKPRKELRKREAKSADEIPKIHLFLFAERGLLGIKKILETTTVYSSISSIGTQVTPNDT